MTINLTTLKSDILTGPLSSELTGKTDAAIADILNEQRVGVAHRVPADPLPSQTVFSAFVPSDLAALTTLQIQILQLALVCGEVDLRAANVRTILSNAFPAGSATRTALAALVNRDGSRTEALFGSGVTITPSDVANARRA
jgi:hypothetical protein